VLEEQRTRKGTRPPFEACHLALYSSLIALVDRASPGTLCLFPNSSRYSTELKVIVPKTIVNCTCLIYLNIKAYFPSI
jgi:hypothetical protein